jgi:hypothetical protein
LTALNAKATTASETNVEIKLEWDQEGIWEANALEQDHSEIADHPIVGQGLDHYSGGSSLLSL